MDGTDNLRHDQAPMVQPKAGAGEQLTLPGSGVAPTMYAGDWRAQLPPGSRSRIVNKILETLRKHVHFSGQEEPGELEANAVRFEEKIYSTATSQSDYLRNISLKMLTMETKTAMGIRQMIGDIHGILDGALEYEGDDLVGL